MDLNPPTAVHFLDWDMMLRLGAAAALGLLLGLDRELRGHAAGMRTHGIVCFSAAASTVSMIALFNQLGGEESQLDVLRIYEATGAFVGFVGAGLVIFSKGKLHNLTTAANLWLASVVGMGCGAAQWPLVAIASVIGLVMITLLRIVEVKFLPGDRHLDATRRKESA